VRAHGGRDGRYQAATRRPQTDTPDNRPGTPTGTKTPSSRHSHKHTIQRSVTNPGADNASTWKCSAARAS